MWICSGVLHGYPFDDLVHAWDTISALDGESDETCFAPSGVPRILDDPVVLFDYRSGGSAFRDELFFTAVSPSVHKSSVAIAPSGSSLSPGHSCAGPFVYVVSGDSLDDGLTSESNDNDSMVNP